MGREIRGVVGGKFHVKDDEVIMIYEKKVTRYGNGAKIDAPKRYLGKGVCCYSERLVDFCPKAG